MSYIDWSDPEGLFDMLIEYVADEKNEAHGDPSRERSWCIGLVSFLAVPHTIHSIAPKFAWLIAAISLFGLFAIKTVSKGIHHE